MREWPRPSTWSASSVTPKADCRSRTHTRAKWSTPASAISGSTWTSAKAGPAAGTPCAHCGCFAGQADRALVRGLAVGLGDPSARPARDGGEDLHDELRARRECRDLRRDELVLERDVAYVIQIERL